MHEKKDKVSLILDGPDITVLGTGAGNARVFVGPGAGAEVKDQVQKAPDIQGAHGRAWLCDLDAGRAKLSIPKENDGTVAIWVVEAPWAHPIWSSYAVILVHLRPLPDGRETVFYIEGATHELWVFALDPDKGREDLIRTGISGGMLLQPKNFGAQFIEVSDELAIDRVRGCVDKICAGELSPDTDWLRDWVALFNDKMVKPEFR